VGVEVKLWGECWGCFFVDGGGGIFMAFGLGKGVKNRVREYGLVVV